MVPCSQQERGDLFEGKVDRFIAASRGTLDDCRKYILVSQEFWLVRLPWDLVVPALLRIMVPADQDVQGEACLVAVINRQQPVQAKLCDVAMG